MAGSRELVDAMSDHGGREDYGQSNSAPTLRTVRQRRRKGAQDKRDALARAIEGEIIPRLMLAHSLDRGRTPRPERDRLEVDQDDVAVIAEMAMTQPVDAGIAYLQLLQLRGHSADSIFVDVIGPAARRLGEMWVADVYDFSELTVGFTRLQQMLYGFSPAFENEDERRFASRRALLAPCPGEQHSLGLFMVQEFFRRAGWRLHTDPPKTEAELTDVVRAHRFDVVGFSLSCEVFIDQLKSAIQITRRHSKNRSVGIMVGGRLFNERPELVAVVGADSTAVDGREAILRLPALLGLTAAAC
ncbi:MAG: B12-binding domain-containing protein [Hyphomicrobium sp.]